MFVSDRYIEYLKRGIFLDRNFRSEFGLIVDFTIWRDYLALYEYYKMILEVPGTIVEFGTRWGKNMVTLVSFRNIFEPFNKSRTIIGFDTFQGFPSLSEEDKNAYNKDLGDVEEGEFSTLVSNWDEELANLLENQSSLLGWPAEEAFDLIKGDAVETIPKYFAEHPRPISLALFDFDLYEPTKRALENAWPLVNKGSVLVFDQYDYEKWPGETKAVNEFFAEKGIKPNLKRLPFTQFGCYYVVE
jgi:hypothetical protein